MASFDKIKFNNSGAADTADTAFVIINAVQQLSSELQVAGLSMAFMAMCRHLSVDPSDAYNISNRIVADKSHGIEAAKKLGALNEYIINEIK